MTIVKSLSKLGHNQVISKLKDLIDKEHRKQVLILKTTEIKNSEIMAKSPNQNFKQETQIACSKAATMFLNR